MVLCLWLLTGTSVDTVSEDGAAGNKAVTQAPVMLSGARGRAANAETQSARGRMTIHVLGPDGPVSDAEVGTWWATDGRKALEVLGRTNRVGRLEVEAPDRFGMRSLVASASGHLAREVAVAQGQRTVRILLAKIRRRLTVRAHTPGGTAVVAAEVEVQAGPYNKRVQFGRTDAQGLVRLGLPAYGNCTVRVRASGFEGAVVRFNAQDASEQQDMILELTPADPLRGGVVDQLTREPIAGAVVTDGFGQQDTTDHDGRYELPGGDSLVRVTATGYREGIGYRDGARRIGLLPDSATAASSAPHGQVLWTDGTPLAEAEVMVPMGRSRTDEEGRFRLPAGSWWLVEVQHGDWRLAAQPMNRSASKEGLVIRVPPVAAFRGRVPVARQAGVSVEIGSGSIVSSKSARLWGTRVPAPIAIDAGGRFTVRIPQGRYRVVLRPMDGSDVLTHSEWVVVEAGMEERVFDLALGKKTHIRVTAPDGSPVLGARISGVRRSADPFVSSPIERLTDTQGDATFEGMPDTSASYRIECEHGILRKTLAPGRHTVSFSQRPRLIVQLEREPMPDGTPCTIEIAPADGTGVQTTAGLVAGGRIEALLPTLDPNTAYVVGLKAKGPGVRGEGYYSPWAAMKRSADGLRATASATVYRWDEDE